jgi:two-component system, cell cycle response regulator CtrA
VKVTTRILLVEDDAATADTLALVLKSEGFDVVTVGLGQDGIDLVSGEKFDLVLLDLNLPDMSGYDILRQLRRAQVDTPILILSGIAGVEDRVKGLSFGADDYVTKPFNRDELIARVRAVIRRTQGKEPTVITVDDLSVNLDAKTAEVAGNRVHLTGKEYELLEMLAVRKGTTLTKEMILNQLYGGMDEPSLKIIDVFVCKLRKKLATASGGKNYVATTWGRGYSLADPSNIDENMALSA